MADTALPPELAERIKEGRWHRYVPGETLLEFGRWAIGVGPRGPRFMPVTELAKYGAKFVFVVPRIPKDV